MIFYGSVLEERQKEDRAESAKLYSQIVFLKPF